MNDYDTVIWLGKVTAIALIVGMLLMTGVRLCNDKLNQLVPPVTIDLNKYL